MTPTKRILIAAVLAASAACSADSRETSEEQTDALMVSQPAAEPGYALAAATPPPPQPANTSSDQPPAHALADSIRTTMLIRNGTATIKVDSLERAIAAVRALAARVNGMVTNVEMQGGEEQIRRAVVTIRMSPDRFDDAVTNLRPIGTVEAVNVTSEDVGEEYVDVQMRVANSRRLEARLLELLASRTGTLEHVLTVERELARVREQIERQEGRLRYLRTRAAVSTLSVAVHEPGPLVASHPGQSVLLRSLRQSLRNFIGLMAVLIESLGIVLPLAALAWAGWLVYDRVERRKPTPPPQPLGSITPS